MSTFTLARRRRGRATPGSGAGDRGAAMSLLTALGAYRRSRVKRLGKWTLRALTAFLGRQSRVGDPTVFDSAQFAWTKQLEADWECVRAEVEALLELREHLPSFQSISPDQYRISDDDRWKVYVLYGFGYRSEADLRRCPATARLLQQIPGLETAMFSILAPGKRIQPHRGITKGLIRCHLGLIVPRDAGNCAFRIGGQVHEWQPGKTLVFDDTALHEVWNDTEEQRVVLLLDFRRPLRPLGDWVSRALLRVLRMTAYVKDARRNQAAWEARFASVAARRG